MHQTISLRRCFIAVALAAALLAWPAVGDAQLGGILPPPPTTTTGTVVGNASAVQATIPGITILGIATPDTTTVLSGTGPIGGNDALDTSMLTGGVPSMLTAETLSATAISYADEVDSAASLGNLSMTVAGIGITADFVMAQASQVSGAPGSGSSTLTNLLINGTPIAVSGDPNQAIPIPGGQVIINEQTISSTGSAVVNALHVVVAGVADVAIASATAGIS